MIYIYPYKIASASAQQLRQGLSQALNYRVKLVKPNGRFNPRRRDKVINWGSSTQPNWEFNWRVDLNLPQAISLSTNKLLSFDRFKGDGISTPEWTTSRETAAGWFNTAGAKVVCRTVLNGHSGQGITIAETPQQLVDAPLYVLYKKKKHEYRVHVFRNEVIDFQQKRKRDGFRENPVYNPLVRNHHTGWVYCRDNITLTDALRNEAIYAVNALGLDFGAVDIIFNEHENKYYVLEVNTAPGLEGETLNYYVKAFLK